MRTNLVKAALAAAFLFLLPSLALAGTNIKQNSDGSASWVDSLGNEQPIRETHLNTRIPNLSSAATTYVVSPITNVKVSSIRAVVLGQITGTQAVLTASIVNSSGTLVRVLSPSTVAVTSQSVTGTIFTLTPTSNNTLEAGQSIAINTNGASTNAVEAIITVTLSPRS